MAGTIYRVIYPVILTVMSSHLLVHPTGWEEEHLPVAVLIALHVREFTVTIRALWRIGQRVVPILLGGPVEIDTGCRLHLALLEQPSS